MNVYLLKNFNNYYNRKIKFYSNIFDYENYFIDVSGEGSGYTSYNFNPNDGVNTLITIGKGEWIDIPDYCIVQDSTTFEIDSRWYVIECTRTRGGQYNLTLRRDLLADYWTNVIDADTYIHRATVSPTSAYITNGESISVNQIKKDETLLKDRTGCSWLVAYLARKNAEGQDTTFKGTVTPPGVVDLTANDKTAWLAEFPTGGRKEYTNGNTYRCNFGFRKAAPGSTEKFLNIELSQATSGGTVNSQYSTYKKSYGYINASTVVNNGYDDFVSKVGRTFNLVMSEIPSSLGINLKPNSRYTELLQYDGKTIKFNNDDNIYKIRTRVATEQKVLITDNNNYKALPVYNQMKELWSTPLGLSKNDWSFNLVTWLYISMYVSSIELELTAIGQSNSLSYSVGFSREHLSDAPYDMICAPYESIQLEASGVERFESQELAVTTVFTDMVNKYAGNAGALYDIQRLPYCPIDQIKESGTDGVLDFTEYSSATKVFYITQGNTKVGVIFSCAVSNFSGVISLDNPIVINNPKMQSICEKYRFVSPNYNGIFEFDPVKNNGLAEVFYYCTYKPFQPFIQVTPNFNYLYGDDYRDNRGLICGGDFSMPIVTSAWETYQRQNKNFQDIFDRGIQSLDLQQRMGRIGDITSIFSGGISAGAGGALAGASIGGGWGAAIGGVVGAVGSGIAGYFDYKLNEELRRDARDYRFDIHQLQLGNIQALPQSLSKTSAFVISNKIWPFLEKYDCTEEEKRSVAQFIAYNGMTLGVVDKVENYIGNTFSYDDITSKNYIQGTIMRFNNELDEEFHLAKEISNELYKGVYIEQWA